MLESYRHAPGEEQSREISLGDLAPSTQQRLRASFEGRGALVLLDEPVPRLGTPRRWGALGLLGLAPLALQLGVSSQRPLWISVPGLVAIAVGFSLSFAAAMLAWRLRRAGEIRPGVFLFARELVDARALPSLRLLPTSGLESVRSDGSQFWLQFQGGQRFCFSQARAAARGEEAASELPRRIATLRERAERADSVGDLAEQQALDPFCEERDRWGQEKPAATAPRRRIPAGLVAPAIAVASLALGAALAWPAARAVASLHDATSIEQASRDGEVETLLRFARAVPEVGVAGGHRPRALDALYKRLPSRTDLELHFALLAFEDPRRAAVEEQIIRRSVLASDRAALRRFALMSTPQAAKVHQEHLPRLELAAAIESMNLRGLWKLVEDKEIDPSIREEAKAAIGRLYAQERAILLGKTRLATPLAQLADEVLTVLAKSSHAVEASAEGHATGEIASEVEASRARLNTEARKAMVHAFYTHLDPDLFRVRAQSDAEASPDEESPRLQLLYKMRATTDEPLSPVAIEVTLALMHPGRESPRRVELRFVVPSPLEASEDGGVNEQFYEKLRDVLAEALRGG